MKQAPLHGSVAISSSSPLGAAKSHTSERGLFDFGIDPFDYSNMNKSHQ